MFSINEDETEAQVLRRDKEDIYHLETVRIFEEAFGLKQLERTIKEVQDKHQKLLDCPKENRDVFSAKDLSSNQEQVRNFQMRHSTITERINETYKISNRMLDYLEKQIILDYHFRGEQEVFEQEQPELKDKALKLMGVQLYHELGSYEGPVTSET